MKFEIREMKNLARLKTGGFAHTFRVEKTSELVEFLRMFESFRVLGNGSNVVFSDSGISEPVIKLGGEFKRIVSSGGEVIAGAGCLLAEVIKKCFEISLSGLERLAGIPAEVGGAVAMNAGAFGTEISDFIGWIKVADRKGVRKISRKGLSCGYRRVSFGHSAVVTEVCFNLVKSDRGKIMAGLKKAISRRAERGFFVKNSTGCIFKNPVGGYAGELIERAGLKGERFGGAAVSTRHANIFVKTLNAPASDVYCLMQRIRLGVFEKSGIFLEPLVEFWGDFR
ncbi:MAG: UDP-N-acetylmuramate dehydrogenase [bacterium]